MIELSWNYIGCYAVALLLIETVRGEICKVNPSKVDNIMEGVMTFAAAVLITLVVIGGIVELSGSNIISIN